MVVAAGVDAAAAVLAVAVVVAAAAGVVGDGVVARGVVVAIGAVVGAVAVASAGVTGAVVVADAAEDDGVGDASGGRAAAAARGEVLLCAGEDADFGGAPAGFAGAVVRAARSDTGRFETAGRVGDELAGTREGVELADAPGRVELDGVEVGRLFAVLPEVAVEGDDFAALDVRSWFAVDRSLPAGVIFGADLGGGAASGTGPRRDTVTSVAGPGGGTATSVIGLAFFVAGCSSGAAACGDTAAIR